ncbi:MAG: UDP-N-acetylglucosamine 2-epimerase (non-hydrolyzing) [Acidimicrobiales bacterium]|nr:UDP-N-acetylglucosamine 2-epimerase (non-hydrolyzing) [Acidimicrobiales bacterium]
MSHDRTGRVAIVLGTRPEIVKLAGLVRLLGERAWVVHTGQHYDAELSDVFFAQFGLQPPLDALDVGGRTRGAQIGEATTRLDALFGDERPAAVIVQGDTNSALAGALAANAREVPLVHVEAGLRSHDRAMPEEHNRVLVDHVADLCLAPTETSRANLLAEAIPGDRIAVTGNTVVEAVQALLPGPEERQALLATHDVAREGFVLSTFHRPENVDDAERLAAILEQLASLPVPVVLPVHPRLAARVEGFGLQHLLDRLHPVAPLGYQEFLGLFAEAALAVSDSGGVQEEASVVKRPVVVVRRSTERPEVLGTFSVLAGVGEEIGTAATAWLDAPGAVHERLAALPSPYGNGDASRLALDAMARMHLLADVGK